MKHRVALAWPGTPWWRLAMGGGRRWAVALDAYLAVAPGLACEQSVKGARFEAELRRGRRRRRLTGGGQRLWENGSETLRSGRERIGGVGPRARQ